MTTEHKHHKLLKILAWIFGILAGAGLLWFAWVRFFKFSMSKIKSAILSYANKYGDKASQVSSDLTKRVNENLALHESKIMDYAKSNNLSPEDAVVKMSFDELSQEGLIPAQAPQGVQDNNTDTNTNTQQQ